VPGPTAHPDATIVGRAPQLALVAGKRIDPEALLESGILVLGGDTAIAELVLRTMRAYV
jgi:predicted lipid carrier protein YhbT